MTLDQIRGRSEELRQEFLDDVAALCRIESNSYDRPALERCADHVVALVRRLCGEPTSVERVEGGEHGDCFVLTFAGSRPGRVALVGHYDTVWPAGTLAGWDVADDDERLSLPGVFDMKFGLVQGLYALRVVDGLGLDRPEVALVINGDEEIGSPASRPTIERVCADADATLVLEAAAPGGAIKSGRKGVGIVGVEVTGVESHAGLEPEKGASAIHAMAEVVTQLVALADPGAGTTVNVGLVEGGSGSNVVAGRATGLVDIRVPDAAEQERVDRGLDGLRASDPRVRLRLDRNWNRPPMALDDTSRPLLGRVKDVAARLGRPLEDVAVGGASDANFVAGIGRPVVCGLGAEGSGAHARHEYVEPGCAPFRIALVAGVIAGV
ncbi:M20 family metallopeptidase [Mariniluteicoccus endophyticus]